MPDDDDRSVRDSDRIWRLEQRYKDLVERLNAIDKAAAEARYRADQAHNTAEILRTRVDAQEQRNRNGGGGQKSILQDSAFVRGVIAVLITGLLAFATGRFFDLGG